MVDVSVRSGLAAALGDWRRHVAAALLVALAFGVASLLASTVAYYTAVLFAFTVWMAWFVLTGVHFLRALDA